MHDPIDSTCPLIRTIRQLLVTRSVSLDAETSYASTSEARCRWRVVVAEILGGAGRCPSRIISKPTAPQGTRLFVRVWFVTGAERYRHSRERERHAVGLEMPL